jgi:hypothetical protein
LKEGDQARNKVCSLRCSQLRSQLRCRLCRQPEKLAAGWAPRRGLWLGQKRLPGRPTPHRAAESTVHNAVQNPIQKRCALVQLYKRRAKNDTRLTSGHPTSSSSEKKDLTLVNRAEVNTNTLMAKKTLYTYVFVRFERKRKTYGCSASSSRKGIVCGSYSASCAASFAAS